MVGSNKRGYEEKREGKQRKGNVGDGRDGEGCGRRKNGGGNGVGQENGGKKMLGKRGLKDGGAYLAGFGRC
jgi:hypothetical protein